jgi:hypothetical protein
MFHAAIGKNITSKSKVFSSCSSKLYLFQVVAPWLVNTSTKIGVVPMTLQIPQAQVQLIDLFSQLARN